MVALASNLPVPERPGRTPKITTNLFLSRMFRGAPAGSL